MVLIILILILAVLIATIVFFAKPSILSKNPPKRGMILVTGFGTIILLIYITTWLPGSKSNSQLMSEAKKEYAEENWDKAVDLLNDMTDDPKYNDEKTQYLAMIDSVSSMTRAQRDSVEKQIAEQERLDKIQRQNENRIIALSGIIEDIEKKKLPNQEMKTMSDLRSIMSAIASREVTLKDGETSSNEEVESLRSKALALQSKEQTKLFPMLRRAYGKIADKELWVEDIDVETKGGGNKRVRFIGGHFALNSNKQDFQTELQGMLKELRFTRSEYMWNKIAEEYTYYEMDTPKDSEVLNQ